MDPGSDYLNALQTAEVELSEAVAQQEKLQKRVITLRKTIAALRSQCVDKGIELPVGPDQAGELLQSSLADQIREVLKARMGEGLRPFEIKKELEQLGFNLSKYRNPQVTIQMVLKRMCGSYEVIEERDKGQKQIYRYARLAEKIGAQMMGTKDPVR